MKPQNTQLHTVLLDQARYLVSNGDLTSNGYWHLVSVVGRELGQPPIDLCIKSLLSIGKDVEGLPEYLEALVDECSD